MKSGLMKRGNFYHYKYWDNEEGRSRWVSTRQTTWEKANQWIHINILQPQDERLREEALGLKPIKRALFKDFVQKEYWPSAEENNKQSTVESNRKKIRWLERFFEDIQLSEISESLIEDYKVWRKSQEKRGYGKGKPKGATINRELKLLSKICSYALKRGYLRENPTRNIEYYPEKPTRATVVRKRDFEEKFLPNCNPKEQYATREFFDFAFRTGARLSEITGLSWGDIDFDSGHIAFLDTKNKEPRYFPMTDYLRNMLVKLCETRISEYVFPKENGKRRGDVRTAFANTLRRAGLPRMRFHDLRHSFVSVCASMGMSWEQTAELTGHKSYAMYRRYKHLFQRDQKKLLERWDHS